jgi:hypothetical protein
MPKLNTFFSEKQIFSGLFLRKMFLSKYYGALHLYEMFQ